MSEGIDPFTKTQWTEIFVFGFVVSLAWWLLRPNRVTATVPGDKIISVQSPVASATTELVTPPFGLPSLVIPADSGTGAACDCHVCPAGSSFVPTIDQIVNTTNAYLQQIYQSSRASIEKVLETVAQGNEGIVNFQKAPPPDLPSWQVDAAPMNWGVGFAATDISQLASMSWSSTGL
jgi:hypothetical protein